MMALLATLFTWANAPYTTAILVVVFSLLFQIFGLLPWSEADHALAGDAGDADGSHTLTGDTHHDVDAGHDVDTDHDADHHQDTDGEGVLALLGVGKVPLSIVLQTLFMMFGLVGVSATTLIAWTTGHLATSYLALSVPIALVGGLLLSMATVRAVAHVVPSVSGQAHTRRELVGQSGVVISSKVSAEFGEVRLQDPTGRTLRLVCYTSADEPLIPEGTEVLITDWDRERDRLYVTPVARLLGAGLTEAEGAGRRQRRGQGQS
jgi:membrane protein implicated in regulation of membrane protease activity